MAGWCALELMYYLLAWLVLHTCAWLGCVFAKAIHADIKLAAMQAGEYAKNAPSTHYLICENPEVVCVGANLNKSALEWS